MPRFSPLARLARVERREFYVMQCRISRFLRVVLLRQRGRGQVSIRRTATCAPRGACRPPRRSHVSRRRLQGSAWRRAARKNRPAGARRVRMRSLVSRASIPSTSAPGMATVHAVTPAGVRRAAKRRALRERTGVASCASISHETRRPRSGARAAHLRGRRRSAPCRRHSWRAQDIGRQTGRAQDRRALRPLRLAWPRQARSRGAAIEAGGS